MPNIEDFTELNEDHEGSLDILMAWDSVRVKFLMLDAERRMAKRVPDGLFAEMMYTLVLEDRMDYLRGDIS